MRQNDSDPYRVLGLARGLGLAEVRGAFRRLAKIHHPDRPGGSDESFRRIQEAYRSILIEVSHRIPGLNTKERHLPDRCRLDIRLTIELTIEDLVAGRNLNICYRRREPCPVCRPRPDEDCPVCLGLGRVFRPGPAGLAAVPCPACMQAHAGHPMCGRCGNRGLVERPAEVRVEAPPGLSESVSLRLPGQGHCPPGAAIPSLPGDLYLDIAVLPHPLFRREGLDLHLSRNLPAWPSGDPMIVPTPEGPVRLKQPPRSPRVLRFQGRGLPELDSAVRGDLFVHY